MNRLFRLPLRPSRDRSRRQSPETQWTDNPAGLFDPLHAAVSWNVYSEWPISNKTLFQLIFLQTCVGERICQPSEIDSLNQQVRSMPLTYPRIPCATNPRSKLQLFSAGSP